MNLTVRESLKCKLATLTHEEWEELAEMLTEAMLRKAPSKPACGNCGTVLYEAEVAYGEGLCFGDECLGPEFDAREKFRP